MVPLVVPARRRAGRVVLVVLGAVVATAVAGLAFVLVVGGVLVPARYLEPWRPGYHQQFRDPRVQVVSQALLAPSGHNEQPWRVVLDPTDPAVLLLHVDAGRLTPAVDPLARQTMISQGTFLGYLQVSARHLGYAAAVELFPRGPYDESHLERSMRELPVARVTLTPQAPVAGGDEDAMFLSDTNRSPYADETLTLAQEAELTGLGSAAVTVSVTEDRKDLGVIGDLATRGTLVESRYRPAVLESDAVFHASEGGKNEARSGFAVEGQGTHGVDRYLLQGMIRLVPALNSDAAQADRANASTAAAVARTPAYALLETATNTRTEQVEAGITYARFSLRARTLGLVVQPLSQVLEEYPEMAVPRAEVHRAFAPRGQTIQVLVRVGTATKDYPVTMRRSATSLSSPR